jgi:hypothetical protein
VFCLVLRIINENSVNFLVFVNETLLFLSLMMNLRFYRVKQV